jgi:hypothetical protein
MHDDTLLTLLADRANLSVARRVPLPMFAAIAAAPQYHWERDEHGYMNRSDLATVRTCTRVGSFDAEIELTPWSATATELVLRPAARAPHRWSGRRRRRWYSAAHTAADALRHDLLAARGPQLEEGGRAPAHRPRMAG